jgi:hypothetical protein
MITALYFVSYCSHGAQHRPGNSLIRRATYCASSCELVRDRDGWLDSPLLSKTIRALSDKLLSAFQDPPLRMRHGILRISLIDKEVELSLKNQPKESA